MSRIARCLSLFIFLPYDKALVSVLALESDSGPRVLAIQSASSVSIEEIGAVEKPGISSLLIPGSIPALPSGLTSSLSVVVASQPAQIPTQSLSLGSLTGDGAGQQGASLSAVNPLPLVPSVTVPLPSTMSVLPGSLSALAPTSVVPGAATPSLTATTTQDGGLLGGLPSVGLSLPPILPFPQGSSSIALLSPVVSLPLSAARSVLSQVSDRDSNLASVLATIIPTGLIPTDDIASLVSTLGAIIPQLGTELPQDMSVLTSVISEIATIAGSATQDVSSLVGMLTTEVQSLTGTILSGGPPITTLVPVLSLALPTLPSVTLPTIQLSLPSDMLPFISQLASVTNAGSGLTGLSNALGTLAGLENSAVISSITAAIIGALTNIVPASAVSSLLNQATVVPLASAVLTDACSIISLVGASFVTLPIPCGSATATPSVSGGSATVATSVSPARSPTSPGASLSTPAPPTSVPTSASSASSPSGSPGSLTPTSSSLATVSLTRSSSNVEVTIWPTSPSVVSSPGASSSPTISIPLTSGPVSESPTSSNPITPPSTSQISGVTSTSPASTGATAPTASASHSGTGISTTLPSSSGPSSAGCGAGSYMPPTQGGGGGGQNLGPCPGQGYTCDDCPDGWFCPPPQTSAVAAPCGTGWPCYHCLGGWFCIPSGAPHENTLLRLDRVESRLESRPFSGPQTVTLTTFVTAARQPPPLRSADVVSRETMVASSGTTPSSVPRAATAGWAYGGCYKDDSMRSLKNDSITEAVATGMSNELCITFCRIQGYGLAGTENGSQCFCGDSLVDSWLLDDSECSTGCTSGDGGSCGGAWALSMWSPDGKVRIVAGPELQLALPQPAAGVSEINLHTGGVRQAVVPVTSAIYVFPMAYDTVPTTLKTTILPASSSCESEATLLGIASIFSPGALEQVGGGAPESSAVTGVAGQTQ